MIRLFVKFSGGVLAASIILLVTNVTSGSPLFDDLVSRLKSKHGHPISETYKVSDNLAATVLYGPNKTLCWLEISELRPDGPNETVPQPGEVDRVLNELIPVADRGKELSSGFTTMVCKPDECDGRVISWEHVRILRINRNHKSNKYRFIQAKFKNASCN
jgi:hypothetical protein